MHFGISAFGDKPYRRRMSARVCSVCRLLRRKRRLFLRRGGAARIARRGSLASANREIHNCNDSFLARQRAISSAQAARRARARINLCGFSPAFGSIHFVYNRVCRRLSAYLRLCCSDCRMRNGVACRVRIFNLRSSCVFA